MGRGGIRIAEVERASLSEQVGLAPGDEILTINGHSITDEIALRFYLAEDHALIEVRKAQGNEQQIEVDLSAGANLGIRAEDFKTQTCNNACLFCFIDQLPPGVRPSLLVKDDDYRLSFLHGNYITLTNLADRGLDRIIEQALSPLYVSVHATDPLIRAMVMGRKKADDLDRKLRKLIAGGIRLHTQIVLMPSINDGSHLEKTLFDLFGYYPGVDSVAIVPLGLSDHGSPRHCFTPVTAEYCRQLIDLVKPWQERFRKKTNKTFAYLADEFYIQAGFPLPETAHYDDFAQIEDGVGMVRRFLNEFEIEWKRRRKPRPRLDGTLATAKLFFPYLKSCADRFNRKFGSQVRVVEIKNRFIGSSITVAGLLAGRDILASLRNKVLGSWVIIPNEAVSRIDGILIDNLSPKDLERELGLPVFPSGRTMRDFFALLE
jgi:putative radical SAM enzyme (TIGR03279 family)